MTIYKDIYPQTILNIINNENFDNIKLDSPMIKPEVIAKALNITFDEKLTINFNSASSQIYTMTSSQIAGKTCGGSLTLSSV